jgi:hypothetical protein
MRKSLMILVSLLAAGIVLFIYPLMVLSLEAQGRAFFLRVVRAGDTFQLGYLHSVARSDVWDTFQVDSQGRIVLIETRFQGQAYGLPAGPEGKEQWTREGDWFRITGVRRVVPVIDWRIQSEWKDRFRFREESEMDVSSLLGDGLIRIQVNQARLIDWLGFYLRRFVQTDS